MPIFSAWATDTSQAVFLSSVVIKSDDQRFGGLSAVIVDSADRALALGDRGTMWTVDLTRDAGGQIADARALPAMLLRPGQIRGQPPLRLDTEGIARLPSGELAVSFEFRPHVAIYPPVPDQGGLRQAKPIFMLAHEGWPDMSTNRMFESLAVDSQGRLYTMPEKGTVGGEIPLFRWEGARWQLFAGLPLSDPFVPVGADFGPDGRFYLLERQFAGIGFRTQLRSFALGLNGMSDMKTHLRTFVGEHDNLEGLSVWQDATGALRATMVADDNFNAFQRSEIVEYRLR